MEHSADARRPVDEDVGFGLELFRRLVGAHADADRGLELALLDELSQPGESVVTSTCAHNCGGRCVVNAHVRDDRIVHISTDMRRWNPQHPPLPACARGVGQIERVYHPDRLKYPLRRVGPRGSGEWQRIYERNLPGVPVPGEPPPPDWRDVYRLEPNAG